MLEAFRGGGPFMFAIVAADAVMVVALLATLAARGTAGRVVAGLALGFAVIPGALGLVGYTLALRQVDAAIQMAAPEYRAILAERGHAEALSLVWFGGGSAAIGTLAALVAVGRAFRPAESE